MPSNGGSGMPSSSVARPDPSNRMQQSVLRARKCTRFGRPGSSGLGAKRERVLQSALVNFDDTPDEAEFRSEVRAFLEQHAKPRANDETDWSRNGAATD